MTKTEHPLVEKSVEHSFNLGIEYVRLFGKGDYAVLVQKCMDAPGNNDTRGALLVFMCASRNPALVKAAEAAEFDKVIRGNVSERAYTYLWAHMHDDLMWLVNQDDKWCKGVATGMPWKIVLAERFHRKEWSQSLALLLAQWEPTKLSKYPYALKYMVNPSERHVLEAACAKDMAHINPELLESMRPGASQWFKVRKELGLEETPGHVKQAFRQWWNQGRANYMPELDTAVFEPE